MELLPHSDRDQTFITSLNMMVNQDSVVINPNSLLAIFSIGECYFRSGQYSEAKAYFEKASQIDPSHPKPKEFLAAINNKLDK